MHCHFLTLGLRLDVHCIDGLKSRSLGSMAHIIILFPFDWFSIRHGQI